MLYVKFILRKKGKEVGREEGRKEKRRKGKKREGIKGRKNRIFLVLAKWKSVGN